MWFIGEWWNDASSDNVAYLFGLLAHWKIINFNQIIAILLLMWGSWRLAHIIPSPLSEWIIRIGDAIADNIEKWSEKKNKSLKRHYNLSKKYILNLIKRIKK